MTRTEYTNKRRAIQQAAAQDTVDENLRHNREIGVIASALRSSIKELDAEFLAAGGTFERR